MKLGFVFVHYHTPDLLAQSVTAIRRELERSGAAGDLVVVDNGSTDEERRALEALPVRVLGQSANPGYAAALNLGIANVEGYVVFLMNPDVIVQPGCVAELVAALDAGADAAGPRFFWDEDQTFLLPPTEERTRSAELIARLATRGTWLARYARGRWRRHARRHWLATEPIETVSLSGALLAVRREAFAEVGEFDEGFRLYYEENDWLLRLRRRGLKSLHVPAAEAVHFYNQSAVNEPSAAQWSADSQLRFEGRHFGSWFSKVLALVEKAPSGRPAARNPSTAEVPTLRAPARSRETAQSPWVEVSPLARGFPAAAARIDFDLGVWRFPMNLWDRLAPGVYSLRLCAESGRELVCATFRRPRETRTDI